MNSDKAEGKIKLFRSLFSGREDIYARFWHNPKNTQSGYSPVYRLNIRSLTLADSVVDVHLPVKK